MEGDAVALAPWRLGRRAIHATTTTAPPPPSLHRRRGRRPAARCHLSSAYSSSRTCSLRPDFQSQARQWGKEGGP